MVLAAFFTCKDEQTPPPVVEKPVVVVPPEEPVVDPPVEPVDPPVEPVDPPVIPPTEPEEPPAEPVPVPEEILALKGTAWELTALVDMATGKTITPRCPKNTKWGEPCYTFTFSNDHPGMGLLHLCGSIYIDFSRKKVVGFPDSLGLILPDMICPESNYGLFDNIAQTISACEYTNGELKFFCKDSTAYLLLKPYEEKIFPTIPVPDEILALTGKTLELVGLMDAASDEVIMPCPDDCGRKSYLIQFWEGGKASLRFNCLDASLHFDRNPVVLWIYFIDSKCNATDPLFEPVSTIESCVYKNNQLKLICNNKKNYLSFKLLEQ